MFAGVRCRGALRRLTGGLVAVLFWGFPAGADVIPDRLQELHRSFADLPGFVDVYYHPGREVPFRPLFLGSVPRAAEARPTPVRVAFDVLPGNIVPFGSGPLPDLNDTFCSGIRPGALLIAGSASCTAGFVFTAGADQFLSAAGHCLDVGDSVMIPNVGVIGTAVYSTGTASSSVGTDFALIRVNPSLHAQVSPEICDWAGPTGTFGGVSIDARRLYQTGQGLGLTNVPRPKVGLGVAIGARSFQYLGASVPGDSGSPVRLDGGQALGLGTAGLVLPPPPGVPLPAIPIPVNFGTTVSRGIALSGISGLSLRTVGWVHGVE